MVAIPFLYFSILALFFYKKAKRIDLAVYIASLYAVCGLFSIGIDVFDMRSPDTSSYVISYEASFVYCTLTTLCIYPIYKFRKFYSFNFQPVSQRPFRVMAIIFFLYTIVVMLLSFSDLMDVLTGDMAAMRTDLYNGYERQTWMLRLPEGIRLPFSIMNMVLGTSWIPMFLAFYCSCILKMQNRYVLMLLATSLLGPILGIIGTDRGAVSFWLICLLGCYLFFLPKMDFSSKKFWRILIVVLASLLVLYLTAMTIARFGDRTTSNSLSGNQFSIIDYLGQAYINFCFFYDNFEPRFFNPALLFPFTASTIFGYQFSSLLDMHEYLAAVTGLDFGVFPSFLGNFVQAMGKIGLFVYVILFYFVSSALLSRPRNRGSLFGGFLYMLFASITMLGTFTYYYSSAPRTFSVAVFLIIIYWISHQKTRKLL